MYGLDQSYLFIPRSSRTLTEDRQTQLENDNAAGVTFFSGTRHETDTLRNPYFVVRDFVVFFSLLLPGLVLLQVGES